MAFDTNTRNKLAKMVADARDFLKNEFTQQLQEIYGIQPDGKITALEKLAHLDDEQRDVARLLRERVAHISSGLSAGKPVKVAVDRMTREQSFTVLNRFAALRMCEERGLLQQCVGGGLQSKGFQVYLKTAGSGLGGQYERFRIFIFSIFDEIAIDLGILFDRFSPFGLLFPRDAVLIELLEIINREELKHIWAEDEAIGWIYQYFNSSEERKAMRKASAAPRNSRELAVRNQFFTPRYVVEFLTDNTLGRIWYEMHQGNTKLKEKCRYLVRRPTEIFLETGQEPPEDDEASNENLSQEELLNKTTYIPFRAPKDPRDLKILDPACGSGHFLLYAFDLLETIYKEAWHVTNLPVSEATGCTLREDFESLDELGMAVPELIVRFNLHGIDIDARAVQIAALALWLRAQRSWQKQDVKAAERPRLTKSNIVCAEPMPGDENMLKEFADGLKPKVLGQLVEVIFDKMKLAGEAGSLLKVEEEIKHAVAEACKQWEAKPRLEQVGMFPEIDRPKPKQQELQFDVRDIDDAKFWDRAESLILQSLQKYSERTENGLENSRKMFAEDTAQGFAFIELCRKKFDVVLMNPPFGTASLKSKNIIDIKYPYGKHDIYCCFIERGMELISPYSILGAITNRTGFFLKGSERWRSKLLGDLGTISLLADFGDGVLDSALVETAAYCIRKNSSDQVSSFIRIVEDPLTQKGISLSNKISKNEYINIDISLFNSIPGCPIAYWIGNRGVALFQACKNLESQGFSCQQGVITADDSRFLRLKWEINPVSTIWSPLAKGGDYRLFYSAPDLVVLSDNNFREIDANANRKYPYLKGNAGSMLHLDPKLFTNPGIFYTRRTSSEFSSRVLPENTVYSDKGPAIQKNDYSKSNFSLNLLLGVTNSSAFRALMSVGLGAVGAAARSYETGLVLKVPLPELSKKDKDRLELEVTTCIEHQRFIDSFCETDNWFCCPFVGNKNTHGLSIHSFSDLNVMILKPCAKKIVEAFDNIDSIVWNSYRISGDLMDLITISVKPHDFSLHAEFNDDYNLTLGRNITSYILGSLFGRWDIRYATGNKKPPTLPNPFEQLPTCTLGMLQNASGLPARQKEVPNEYPLRISWNGILVDDEGHTEDIVRRLREVIEVIWRDKTGSIEHEACEIIGVKSLREYFRKPNNFFADHLKRYSKSRRKAPIYWPLSTETGSYTMWIYYHRLTDQTLFTCVNDYVNPKIETIAKDIERLQRELSERETENSVKRGELEKLQEIYQELIEFRKDLLRIAKLPYKPNLNDGVLITASPLWKLFRLKIWQDDLKACWETLETGEYDWAHLACSIWPDRVREKCKTDLSIAIAHDLEHLCEVEPKKTKKKKV